MPNQMVRSLHETARYTKIHITFNVLKSGKLQYLATLLSWRCKTNQLIHYLVDMCLFTDHSLTSNRTSTYFFLKFTFLT